MKYRWLLFDADDTLFDYGQAESNALRRTLEYFGTTYCQNYQKRYRLINQQMFKDFEKGIVTSKELRTKRFVILFSDFNLDIDVDTFSKQYLTNLSQNSMLIEGALETIRQLHPDHQMLIITNGISDVQRPRFERSKIKKYFRDILISDEAGVAKPSIAFFNLAFDLMGKPEKKDVLIIGDSLTADMAGGNTMGVDTCWYNPHGIKNDTGIETLFEIKRLEQIIDITKSS